MERALLCSYWNRYSSVYGFPFPEYNAPPKATIHGLTECFIYHHYIPHGIDSDQWTHFIARAEWQSVTDHGTHWSYPVPHNPEEGGLIERWNGNLKSQWQCQLNGRNLESWGRGLQKAVYALDLHLICGLVLPIVRIYRSRNQGMEKEESYNHYHDQVTH